MKSVIYARVSPTKHIKTVDDMHQSIAESIKVCGNDATHEGNEVIEQYVDQYISGKASKDMPAFQKMMQDAREHKFNRVYCRRVNRFGRNRADMLKAEIELSDLGTTIKFVEDGIDTGKPYGKSIMAILADLAEQDRKEILANTKRGMEAYKANGGVFGPPKKEINVDALRRDRLLPVDVRPTWKECEQRYAVHDKKGNLVPVSTSTLIKRLKEAGYWDEERRTVV